MITDPLFFLVAIPAVLIFGIAKGGFGGGLGVVSVPLMALVISPVQAAAILLPILCLMDLFSLWAWRGKWSWTQLRFLIPAGLLGIAIGTALFGYMSVAVVRLILGTIVIVFSTHWWVQRIRRKKEVKMDANPVIGVLAATTSGFTSFVAHSGGPPLNMYLLAQKMDKSVFVATSVIFFTMANYVKLVPYAWLGQFDTGNMTTSLVLAPLAPIGVALGVWMHRNISDKYFFIICYTFLFVVGLKLLYDGVLGI
jgi:uncharacterized membrane protein YfcA